MTSTVTALPARKGSNEAQLERIRRHIKAGDNMIMLCEPENLPELHRLVVEAVQLSDKPEDGDIFKPSGSSNFAINLRGLEKLMMAASVQWDVHETRPVTITRDYCHYQAVGFILREYGARVAFRADATMDLVSMREDLQSAYERKTDKDRYNKSVEFCVERDISAKRKNMIKLTASDAKAVVIRKILNVQGPYKNTAIFKQPFVIVRCVVAPDYSDPETRKLLSQLSMQSVTGIYGQAPAQLAATAFPPSTNASFDAPEAETIIHDGLVVDDDIPSAKDYDPPLPEPGQQGPGPDELLDADFDGADAKGKAEMLRTLCAEKGVDIDAWLKKNAKRTMAQCAESYLVTLWNHYRGQ